ncbi:YkyB family protein [Paenisporosarcina cavernae]|uniref:YkyB-like protein n=1 Tax=Paenisporosarcina cavernae TaxID=2320858 RepID=A0A385YU30_9BACL|nr:YkyB family protein [Paenisporosarcina cavernae]AYC29072.1 hypothetical protein D3873_03965 [Paenisporosarcina cavernae]
MITGPTNNDLATAIYTINRHAKTAPDNRYLYELKRLAVEKMIGTGRAKKMGMHFVKNPKLSRQQSAVLVKCGDYFFHLLPKKEDFQQLPHLGKLDDHYRNPKQHMSLSTAKKLLSTYTGYHNPISPKHTSSKKKPMSFTSNYLDR